MAEICIQYSTSTAFASMVIRRLSHSRFSHVDFLIPGEGLLGVSGPGHYISGSGAPFHDIGGVIVRPFNAWPYLEPPKIARIQTSDEVVRKAVDAARSQMGKPYDDGALWGFLGDPAREMQRNWRDEGQWYCSELLTWALELAGLWPYPIVVTKDRVSPADNLLLINPFMAPENIADFLPPKQPTVLVDK
jgi:hypothetical protein